MRGVKAEATIVGIRVRRRPEVRKILIATDGSPSATEAVEFGLEIASEQGALPIFVHVAPELDQIPIGGFAPVAAVPHELCELDRRPLEAAEKLAEERDLHAATKVLIGNPADEIVAYADSIDADVIVVGSRGHGTLAGAFLGSVSRGVLHEARRPVLVVRGVKQRAELVA
jgi:nucleotide-binding universal stress UspA family protein